MVIGWRSAPLVVLLALAALQLVALLVLSRWHDRRAARTARLNRSAARLVAAWSRREARPAEVKRLSQAGRAERRAVLMCCAERLPGLDAGAAQRVRDHLRESDLLGPEIDRLRRRSPAARADACRLLGRLGATEAIPMLVERLRDRDPLVRRHAISALADLHAMDALAAILDAIEDTGEWGNLLSTMAVVRMGSASVPQIGARLRVSQSSGMIKTLLQVTGRLGAASDPAHVRALASHGEPEIRIEAVRTLGSIAPEPESVAVCLAAMDDPEWPARAIAAWSLGRLGDERAIGRLEQAMGDTAYWVRQHVAEALAGLGAAGEAALRRGLDHANPFVQDMARQALYMGRASRGRPA